MNSKMSNDPIKNEKPYEKVIHPNIISLLKQRKIHNLYPIQWQAIKAGLRNTNLIISIPTASGKTLIAEILALEKLFKLKKQKTNTSVSKPKKILYLTSLKALALEKFQEFKKSWSNFGLKVGISTSDIDQIDYKIFHNDLIILTNEKANSILRNDITKIQDLAMVICDEIHLINDENRGITLEFLLTLIKHLNPTTQIIGLSATIKNAHELSDWLNAELINSDWRPIELKEGFFIDGKIHFNDDTIRYINQKPNYDDIANLTVDMVEEGGQVLIFTNSRRNTIKLAEDLYQKVELHSTIEEKKKFTQISELFKKECNDNTEISRKLCKFLKGGTAFHHAGLSFPQLKFIIEYYSKKKIKLICCTPTLAAGVNTPARRVIIKSLNRYSAQKGNIFIPIMEYKQMAGRAGRPGYDPYGEVVIVGKNPTKLTQQALTYINGKPENIFSKMDNNNQLQSHILSLIVSKSANSINKIFDFLLNSLYYTQLKKGTIKSSNNNQIKENKISSSINIEQKIKNFQKRKSPILNSHGKRTDPLNLPLISENLFTTASEYWEKSKKLNLNEKSKNENSQYQNNQDNLKANINQKVQSIIDYFLENNLIQNLHQENDKIHDHIIFASVLGKICSQTYISPQDAIQINQDLNLSQKLVKNKVIKLNSISWLNLIARLESIQKYYLRKEEYPRIINFVEKNSKCLIIDHLCTFDSPNFPDFAKNIKMTMILRDWISEIPEKEIAESYYIGIGDIFRIVNNAKWLVRSLYKIAQIYPSSDQLLNIKSLSQRISYGIKSSLIPLVELKGIGRIKARKLYQAGYTTIEKINSAKIEDLALVPLIGENLSKKIKSYSNIQVNSNKKKNSIKPALKKRKLSKKTTISMDKFLK